MLPGELYRSGQPHEGDISRYVQRYGIRTVINLRGDNTGSPWYDREMQESKAAGVLHIDFRMTSKRLITENRARELLMVMKQAPKPVLIHCDGGANRTSLASAIYLAGTKADEDAADGQLSVRYGNFPSWVYRRNVVSDAFDAIKPMFGFSDS